MCCCRLGAPSGSLTCRCRRRAAAAGQQQAPQLSALQGVHWLGLELQQLLVQGWGRALPMPLTAPLLIRSSRCAAQAAAPAVAGVLARCCSPGAPLLAAMNPFTAGALLLGRAVRRVPQASAASEGQTAQTAGLLHLRSLQSSSRAASSRPSQKSRRCHQPALSRCHSSRSSLCSSRRSRRGPTCRMCAHPCPGRQRPGAAAAASAAAAALPAAARCGSGSAPAAALAGRAWVRWCCHICWSAALRVLRWCSPPSCA